MKANEKARWFVLPFLALLASCTSVGSPDIVRISAAVKTATQIGVSELLRDHPEHSAIVLSVHDQLTSLASQDTITVAGLLDAVSRLPVRELSSDTARLSFEAARLVISIAGWSDIEVVQTRQIRPVVVAIAAGIKDGLPRAGPGLAWQTQRGLIEGSHYKLK